MPSDVYFISMRAQSAEENPLSKLKVLFNNVFDPLILNEDIVAIKLHFGELGNTTYIRPIWVREIVKLIKEKKGRPFLTDTNTLYAGSRGQAPEHLQTAILNGFDYASVGAPLIIADGLRGKTGIKIKINKKHFKEVMIATEIYEADVLCVLSHVKAHVLFGFGGALKNLGMGAATKEGKYKMHIGVPPDIEHEKCSGCGLCIKYCPGEALYLFLGKVKMEDRKCISCGACITNCPKEVFKVDWSSPGPSLVQERTVEFLVALSSKKMGFINFLMDITPDCDCASYSDAPIVPDVGILASIDPVALDTASYDLVNRQPGILGTALKQSFSPGENKFRALYPNVDPEVQLRYAEELGLGSRSYRLITL